MRHVLREHAEDDRGSRDHDLGPVAGAVEFGDEREREGRERVRVAADDLVVVTKVRGRVVDLVEDLDAGDVVEDLDVDVPVLSRVHEVVAGVLRRVVPEPAPGPVPRVALGLGVGLDEAERDVEAVVLPEDGGGLVQAGRAVDLGALDRARGEQEHVLGLGEGDLAVDARVEEAPELGADGRDLLDAEGRRELEDRGDDRAVELREVQGLLVEVVRAQELVDVREGGGRARARVRARAVGHLHPARGHGRAPERVDDVLEAEAQARVERRGRRVFRRDGDAVGPSRRQRVGDDALVRDQALREPAAVVVGFDELARGEGRAMVAADDRDVQRRRLGVDELDRGGRQGLEGHRRLVPLDDRAVRRRVGRDVVDEAELVRPRRQLVRAHVLAEPERDRVAVGRGEGEVAGLVDGDVVDVPVRRLQVHDESRRDGAVAAVVGRAVGSRLGEADVAPGRVVLDARVAVVREAEVLEGRAHVVVVAEDDAEALRVSVAVVGEIGVPRGTTGIILAYRRRRN